MLMLLIFSVFVPSTPSFAEILTSKIMSSPASEPFFTVTSLVVDDTG